MDRRIRIAKGNSAVVIETSIGNGVMKNNDAHCNTKVPHPRLD